MFELKNILENRILKHLAIHQAMGEIKLFDTVTNADDKAEYIEFRLALSTLLRKGLIESVMDKTESMTVIRIKQVFN
jgi:hypothetical protein